MSGLKIKLGPLEIEIEEDLAFVMVLLLGAVLGVLGLFTVAAVVI